MITVSLAIAGAVIIMVGVFQELVHVAPEYEATITTGWGGKLNHEEQLIGGLSLVGVGGMVAALRWNRFSIIPTAVGGIVLFYALRALLQTMLNFTLYTETTLYNGDVAVFILGTEPFLLTLGGLLLIGSGIWQLGLHGRFTGVLPETDVLNS